MVAVVGGTILSLIFGYIFAHWREFMDKHAHSLKTQQDWEKSFTRMTSTKEGELAGASRQKKAQNSHDPKNKGARASSRRRGSLADHPEIERYLELSKDFYPSIYQYFLNIKEMGDDVGKWEIEEFKKFSVVNSSFLLERIIELLEMRYFDRFLSPDGSAQMIRLSWLSFSAASLFCDDSRLGSSTISAYLEKKLHLAPQDLYRAVEFAALLSKGGSRLALLESYKKKVDQNFERSLWLQEQTKEQRLALVWTMAHEKSFHALGIGGVIGIIEKAAIELEEALNEAYEQRNREDKSGDGKGENEQKSSQQSKQKRNQKNEKKPAGQSKSKGPYEDEFKALEMDYTQDIILIKKQYKKLAMKYHPDRQGQESSQERFVAIQRAYQTLEKAYSPKAA